MVIAGIDKTATKKRDASMPMILPGFQIKDRFNTETVRLVRCGFVAKFTASLIVLEGGEYTSMNGYEVRWLAWIRGPFHVASLPHAPGRPRDGSIHALPCVTVPAAQFT